MPTRTIRDRFARVVRERGLATAQNPVVLMVSGGSDSAALAYLANGLWESGNLGPIAFFHMNHKLRGQDAEDDADFVRDIASALNQPFFLRDVDIAALAQATGGNVEAVAREERYRAAHEVLEQLCMQANVPMQDGRIFTAHTQDDRVENFYMRSIVGTGPGGFRGMRYRNGQVCRPCLDLSREELQVLLRQRALDAAADPSYVCVLDKNGNPWRTDATNENIDHFRAYVRHSIVPAAQERNPQLLNTLCRTMNLIADEDDMLSSYADELVATHVQWLDVQPQDGVNCSSGCMVAPAVATIAVPLQRRMFTKVLQLVLGEQARVETASVEACVAAFADGAPVSGYTANIQGNIALSANKKGLRIEPMQFYRARRNRL